MSESLDSIIGAAAASIDAGGSDGGDTGDTSSTDTGDTGTDATDLSAASPADAGTDGAAEGADASGSDQPASADAADSGLSAEDLAWQQELAELGISVPKPGQRDNRMPYSRVSKVIANAKKKWLEKVKGEHTTELSARDQKIKDNEERARQFDAAEKLIATDADQYIGLLKKIYPDKYAGWTKAEIKADVAANKPAATPKPGPDIKYDDGTVGYSPEQWEKREEWTRAEAVRQAREEVTKEFNERLKPFEEQRQAQQRETQDIQRVRGDIGKLREQWGPELIDNPEVQKEIVDTLDANPKMTLVAAARTVALGRIGADRTKIRAAVIKELQGAPLAAAKTPAAPVRSDAANATESVDDIIAKAMRSIR